jgi:hypothetical protein
MPKIGHRAVGSGLNYARSNPSESKYTKEIKDLLLLWTFE